MGYRHVPVMVSEVIDILNCSPGKTFVDATLGGGGHAKAILNAVGTDGFLIGIDRDPDAVAHARESLRSFEPRFKVFHSNFSHVPQVLSRLGRAGVDGILLDLGVSLYQLESSGRGFSFMRDEPLDMRMNPEDGETAEGMVNRLSEKALADLIWKFGEERWARRIAKAIVRARRDRRIESSLQLADIVKASIPRRHWPRRIHPATRTFQAVRIAVNHELEDLEDFLDHAVDILNPGARLCIIAFHSLEDRLVKERFRQWARGCECPSDMPVCVCGRVPRVRLATKKALKPQPAEVDANPLARSAKLRAVERLTEGGQ